MRLNGWQRLGVVASVVWALGGAFWGNNLGLHEGDYVVTQYQICTEGPLPVDWNACSQAFARDWPAAISHRWAYAAFFGLVPIPLGWLIVYGLRALVRWIQSGFNKPIP
jgi:hypothetical protein